MKAAAMRQALRWAVLLVGAVLIASPAWAFQYADCKGRACAWNEMPVAYAIQKPLGVSIDDDAAVAEIQASFNRWDHQHQTLCAPLGFTYQGRLETNKPQAQDFKNVVSFQSANWWLSPEALAVTVMYYDTAGWLREADIVFNAEDYHWTTDESDESKNRYAIRPTLTHEVGHFWGLDHSEETMATMYAYYKASIVAEDLDEDDIRGAAERYCESALPTDDADEQNDSFAFFADLGERTEITARLYDDDWYRLDLQAGKRLKLIVADESPERYKRLELYDLQGDRVDEQDCHGDCAQVLGEAGAARRVALRILGGFDNHGVETARYTVRFKQVLPGDEGQLSDDDSVDETDDADSGGGNRCGCAVGVGESPADLGFAALAVLAGLAAWRRLARRRGL